MFDSPSLTQMAPSSVQQWEQAGASLAASLNKYLDLCFSLESSAQQEGMHPRELAIRIDSALETLHATLDCQTSKARSTLTQTRNRIVSPITCFPEEVLSKIFTNAIYDSAVHPNLVSMTDRLVGIYRSTYSLLAVCTAWKDVVLSRGSFWSIIPILQTDSSHFSFGYPQATAISLGRAKSTKLHVVAILPSLEAQVPDMNEYAARVCSINLVCKKRSTINDILNNFWALGSSSQISEMSLRLEFEGDSPGTYYGTDHLFFSDFPKRGSFDQCLSSLSALRLRGVSCHWSTVVFCDRLVEFHLQDVCLGYDSDMAQLIIALSSAINLRDLRFISVHIFSNRGSMRDSLTNPSISLPNLENLLVRNLYANALDYLLSSITSRSHWLTLHLTEKTVQEIDSDVTHPRQVVNSEDVACLFSELSVNTLSLDGTNLLWMSDLAVGRLVSSMPDLETLRIHNWYYDAELCNALSRPQDLNSKPFPQLKNIHLTNAQLRDQRAFQNMLKSHSASLKGMVLGALVYRVIPPYDHTSDIWKPLEGGEEIVLWLEEHVPNFELAVMYKAPPEFQPATWPLW